MASINVKQLFWILVSQVLCQEKVASDLRVFQARKIIVEIALLIFAMLVLVSRCSVQARSCVLAQAVAKAGVIAKDQPFKFLFGGILGFDVSLLRWVFFFPLVYGHLVVVLDLMTGAKHWEENQKVVKA